MSALAEASQVDALIARLEREPTLALDTEGDGMFRYRTRLCTLQLASADEIAIVDTLAVDAARFAALFSAAGPEKVVHDASFDARLLAASGAPLGNVFDTAIAARYLGYQATGLASMLASLFEITLPKHMQMADWGARPLDEEAIAYLENDVRHLFALRDALLERVCAAEIEDEVREECAYVLTEAARVEPERSPFERVKGGHLRPPRERARLYELAQARDEIARSLDEPVARVIANELLIRLAALEAPTLADLEKRLSTRVRPFAARLHETYAIERGDAPAGEPAEHLSPNEIARRKKRRALLMELRTAEATRREVDQQVVLPGHCLQEIVKLPQLNRDTLATIPGLGTARLTRYADRWTQELATKWND
ncbi:MAG TPA: HRDC domain-containing protein [Polyangiales bacterium]|nr:HRDC domain-containing protein [Polyangiales bacterium]